MDRVLGMKKGRAGQGRGMRWVNGQGVGHDKARQGRKEARDGSMDKVLGMTMQGRAGQDKGTR